MPDYDITHPIPDVTGFITEGQIVLGQNLSLRGVYPPIDILPSLSRLMKDGVGEGSTRADHMDVANDIYAAYSIGRNSMDLALVIGEDALAKEERQHLQFARELESKFIMQRRYSRRNIEETMDLGIELLKLIQKG
jgi:V/A-type H+-transporting ATPase subunit B